MYKAIKNFEVKGRKFIIGEEVPAEFVEARLIKSKKITDDAKVQEEVKNTTEEVQLLVETPAEVKEVEVQIETEEVEPVKEVKQDSKKKK